MLRSNASLAAREATTLVLWESAVHENGGGWAGPYVPSPSEAAVKALVSNVHRANKSALVYMSMWFASTRNATVYASHVNAWKERFGIDGIYTDGLCQDDWLVACLLRCVFLCLTPGPTTQLCVARQTAHVVLFVIGAGTKKYG